jgi:hypothetical protein
MLTERRSFESRWVAMGRNSMLMAADKGWAYIERKR